MEDKKIKQQEKNAKTCEIIAEFLDCAGMTNKSFAEFAGINHSTFQGMMNRKTGMKPDTINKVSEAMLTLAELAKDEDDVLAHHMMQLHEDFLNNLYTPTICSTTDIAQELANSVGRSESEQRLAAMKAVSMLVSQVIPSKSVKEKELKCSTPRSRLLDAFDQLNEKGQETAADRVEELSKIPDYQKPDEN